MVAAGIVMAGCGSQAPSPSAPPSLLHGAPSAYVLTLDRLPAAGFTVVMPPGTADVSALTAVTSVQTALRAAGLTGVASAHYVREVPVLATANGPLDVVASAAEFATAAGGHRGMAELVAEVDARSGAGSVSAGDLGEESHAVTQTATASDGTVVVQITVLWRVANVVNEMAVRGRQGGTGLGDAVDIAHRQSDLETRGS